MPPCSCRGRIVRIWSRYAGQRLVHRHARPARVGEDDLDAVPDQRLDQDVGPGRSVYVGRRGLAFVDGRHGYPPSGRDRSRQFPGFRK